MNAKLIYLLKNFQSFIVILRNISELIKINWRHIFEVQLNPSIITFFGSKFALDDLFRVTFYILYINYYILAYQFVVLSRISNVNYIVYCRLVQQKGGFVVTCSYGSEGFLNFEKENHNFVDLVGCKQFSSQMQI